MRCLWIIQFVVITAACLPVAANAQQFETAISSSSRQVIATPLKWGPEFISMFEEGAHMQYAFTFKMDKGKYDIALVRFDSTMKLVKKNQLTGEEKKIGPFPAQMKQIGSKYYLVYSTYNPSDGLQWSLAGIDPEKLTLDTPLH